MPDIRLVALDLDGTVFNDEKEITPRTLEAIRAAIAQAVQTLGPPDLAINSAGIQISAPFEALSSADFNQVIHVNLIGSRNFAAATLPHLRPGSHHGCPCARPDC